MAVFTIAFSIGAEIPVSAEDADKFIEEFSLQIKGIDAMGIFLHNTSIAMPMFIPGFGAAFGVFAAVSTGLAFSAIETSNPMLSDIPPFTILLLSPFGLMELVAYSIGMSRSILLVNDIIKKKTFSSLRPHMRPLIVEIGIVVVLLAAGGFIEFQIIEQFGGKSMLEGTTP